MNLFDTVFDLPHIGFRKFYTVNQSNKYVISLFKYLYKVKRIDNKKYKVLGLNPLGLKGVKKSEVN